MKPMPIESLPASKGAAWIREIFSWPVACLVLAIPVAIPQPVDDSISMGKRTTVFRRSDAWETVTLFEQRAPGDRPTVVSPTLAPPLKLPASIGQSIALPGLERHGVVLIRLARGVEPAAVGSVAANYNHLHAATPTAAGYVAVTGASRAGNPIYRSGPMQLLVVNEVMVKLRSTDPVVAGSILQRAGATVVKLPAVPGRDPYVVRFDGKSGHEALETSNRLDQLEVVEYSHPDFISIDPGRMPVFGPAGIQLNCARCPDPPASSTGGDPFFGKQWHLKNVGDIGKLYADINVEKAWQITQGETSIVIAVLDDRIDMKHPDLAGKVVQPWDAISGESMDPETQLSEFDGHGTAAAGLAAAIVGNGIGVAGVAGKVKIMPIRTHPAEAQISAIVDGIKHAAESAQVLSMSWSIADGPVEIPAVEGALHYASVVKARVLVFAAGNSQGFSVNYPASAISRYPVIAVSATDEFDNLKVITEPQDPCDWGTQFGPDTISAPGVHLYTSDPVDELGFCSSGPAPDYTTFSGTSAATPLVAGAAALMLSANPQLTPAAVRSRLQQAAVGVGRRIDACIALQGGTECNRPSQPQAPTDLDID